MDARKYDPIKHVAPGQFTTEQRQRLESLTAARLLLGDRTLEELLSAAQWIVGGIPT